MMAAAHPLAHVNAALNAFAGVLLVLGYIQIRKGREDAHRRFMVAAFCVSALFLVSYVTHHVQVGSVPFTHAGIARMAYFAILIPHIILAAVVVPLAIVTIDLGNRSTGRRGILEVIRNRAIDRGPDQTAQDRKRHKRLARWTFPIWLYVSVTRRPCLPSCCTTPFRRSANELQYVNLN